MKFKVTIELGDAMQTEGHIAAALHRLSFNLNAGRIPLESEDGTYPSGPIRDVDGNKVGEWEVTP
jgi:hypothetical protein